MRYLLSLFLLLNIAACSYSPETLKQSYNNLGKDYVVELKQLGEITTAQSLALDVFGIEIQQWHRENQLPLYAQLMTDLAIKLENDIALSDADILGFVAMINGYPHFYKADASNYRLADIAKTLTDEQVTQMSELVTEVTDDFAAELSAMSEQKMWREHTPNYHDQREALIAGAIQWNQDFFEVLEIRQQANFSAEFVALMKTDNEYVRLMSRVPKETQENDEYFVAMMQELLASLSDEQKDSLTSRIKSIAETFTELMSSSNH